MVFFFFLIVRAKLCLTFCDSMECSPPGSSAHGIFQRKYWTGLSFPPPVDLLDPGIEPMSPALASRSFTTEPSGKPWINIYFSGRSGRKWSRYLPRIPSLGHRQLSSCCVFTWQKGQEDSEGLFYKVISPFMRVLASQSNYTPNAPPHHHFRD